MRKTLKKRVIVPRIKNKKFENCAGERTREGEPNGSEMETKP